MWFTRISIRNPVFATMMMAACLVLGVFSYQRLAVEQFPDVSVPVIIVQTVYPGAAPEIVERDVTRPLEEAINTISGLRYLSSTSYESLSVITAEFDLGIDAARAAEDVREKVALVQSLFRPEVEEPRTYRFNPADLPILALAVRGEASSLRDLTTIAEAVIAPRIQNILGVGQVTLVGGAKPEIQVLLKPGEMQALGVGVEQVIGALRGDNLEVLDAERSLFNAELDYARNQGDLFQAFVNLYKAMGGGWVVEATRMAPAPNIDVQANPPIFP